VSSTNRFRYDHCIIILKVLDKEFVVVTEP
jgi:hypothetical protein